MPDAPVKRSSGVDWPHRRAERYCAVRKTTKTLLETAAPLHVTGVMTLDHVQ